MIAEHDALIDAIAQRDGGLARELAWRHVSAETERLVNYRLQMRAP